MNERFKLNSELVRAWLDKECRKQSFLSRSLAISDTSVTRMLAGGYVPKERTLKALSELIGVSIEQLLLPKDGAKKAG